MNIEEAKKKLIEWVDDDRVLRDNSTESDFDKFCEEKNIAIETVLAELEKKEKIINAMAKKLIETDITIEACTKLVEDCYADGFTDNSACIECIKQYYEKKVSEDNE